MLRTFLIPEAMPAWRDASILTKTSMIKDYRQEKIKINVNIK